MHCLGLNLWEERGHRCDFVSPLFQGLNLQDLYCDGWWLNDAADLTTIEAFYYSVWTLWDQWFWFKIFNQPQKRFSPLILFISWIKLFLTVVYFVGFYVWQILPEEPERNFFALNFIRLRVTAFWELVQCAFILTIRHGPQYQESTVSLLARVVGLTLPGVVAHNPLNYVNAVRLGPCPLAETIKKDIFQTLRSVFLALPALPGNALWDYLYDKLSTGAQKPRQWTWNKSLKTQI